MQLVGESSATVPAWSGGFWEQDGFGYLPIHCADERTHRPPAGEGWAFLRTIAAVEDDAQIFLYRKVCPDCCGACWDRP